jgi:hypothetical protein
MKAPAGVAVLPATASAAPADDESRSTTAQIDLVDHREGRAGAGRHRQKHQPLSLRDGVLDGLIGSRLDRGR